ncbi:MAG: response regulator, partial [Phycisphaerales bacterium]|nr:response regulator [Phycisphaerales bacterium]
LIAEDNGVNQEVATAILAEMGCTVAAVNNGIEAVAAVKEHTFDLVFMDVQMPEMSGIEATQRIRQWEQADGIAEANRLPIVAMTAHAMKTDISRCLEAGMDKYIAKPINGKRIAEVITQLMANRADLARKHGDAEKTTPPPSLHASEPPHATIGNSDVIDIPDLLHRCMNKPAIARRVLARFKETARDVVLQLEKSLKAEDWEQARVHAHTIKGAAGNISAIALRDAAAKVEQLCKAGADATAKTVFMEVQLQNHRCLKGLPFVLQQLDDIDADIGCRS